VNGASAISRAESVGRCAINRLAASSATIGSGETAQERLENAASRPDGAGTLTTKESPAMSAHARQRRMNVVVKPTWTAMQFLDWVATQEERYEFDGMRPVAMTGGNANHSRITLNIHRALAPRLRGKPCSNFGPDLGIQTIGEKVRFPDGLITCTKFPGTDRIAPNPVAVFEVISPSSGPNDHNLKLAEYQAVASILTYVIIESAIAGVLVYHRDGANLPFTATPLTADGTIELPLLGIQIPVDELYEDVEFAEIVATADEPGPAPDGETDEQIDPDADVP
jgi:Uma2 family endonuclease